ncbi:MAG: hypothetical protein K1X82_12935, partial [Bacteroidia bacterium]|nr:hypothetical protein [Bacteroidia bacterium]
VARGCNLKVLFLIQRFTVSTISIIIYNSGLVNPGIQHIRPIFLEKFNWICYSKRYGCFLHSLHGMVNGCLKCHVEMLWDIPAKSDRSIQNGHAPSGNDRGK